MSAPRTDSDSPVLRVYFSITARVPAPNQRTTCDPHGWVAFDISEDMVWRLEQSAGSALEEGWERAAVRATFADISDNLRELAGPHVLGFIMRLQPAALVAPSMAHYSNTLWFSTTWVPLNKLRNALTRISTRSLFALHWTGGLQLNSMVFVGPKPKPKRLLEAVAAERLDVHAALQAVQGITGAV
jgi:hypothetical protein